MRELSIAGMSPDGSRLVLRSGEDTFELSLAEVRRAQEEKPPDVQAAPAPAPAPRPTPREIQQRIRRGETAANIARLSGLAVDVVARYEGPVLAEREHQAGAARRARVDGRVVAELVEEYLAGNGQAGRTAAWDSWLTETGTWQVQARAGTDLVRLGWDPATGRVQALDDSARQALHLVPRDQDALGAVLRPVAGPGRAGPGPRSPASRATAPRGARAQVPRWSDIISDVSGRLTEPAPRDDPEA
jgi:hypothetical protein